MSQAKTTKSAQSSASTSSHAASPHVDPNESVLTMPLPELQRRVGRATELWSEIVSLFPGAVVLPAAERDTTAGKIRSGEMPALLAIIKVADAFPHFFTSLADLDEGVDPTKFETELLRDRLARADILAPLADAFATRPIGIEDTVLQLRALAKGPISEAYSIAKSLAPTNPVIATLLAPALDFYRKIAQIAAAARKANAQARAAKAPAGNKTGSGDGG